MSVRFREARRDDVPAVVALLQDDVLGSGREADDMAPYLAAFDDMKRDGSNTLIVGERNGQVVATYQLTLITGLSLRATRRANVESIRVATEYRGRGIGALLLADAEARAKAGNAGLMQLAAHKRRIRAHSFYARSGFDQTHEGFKKRL